MRFQHLFLCVVIPVLGACSATLPNNASVPIDKRSTLVTVPMTPVSIGCVGHEGVSYIHAFYVKEPFSEYMAGGISCGGTSASGYILPTQWQPGMKVKVRWNRPIKGEDNWIEKTTTIRRYERAGTLTVHFFANDEVRVVSSARYAPESPMHPLPKSVTIAPPEEE
ncbi:DUF3304 domain-containing protein [Paraherbaspirillum soli]|uniref:DUF3304 domain-containing protein n=1 Tax=Paraherbaspirillum soli TaxID=631222 RepID=A0ABW0ME23_9BURK